MSKIAIPDNPKFNTDMEAMTENTLAHCGEWNSRHAKMLENETSLKNAICHYTKTATLPAGQSTVTFDITDMPEDGIASFVSSSPSLSYTGVSEDTSTKQLTVTFAPVQDTDVTVKLIVKDALE